MMHIKQLLERAGRDGFGGRFVYVRPDVNDFGLLDYARSKEISNLGLVAVEDSIPRALQLGGISAEMLPPDEDIGATDYVMPRGRSFMPGGRLRVTPDTLFPGSPHGSYGSPRNSPLMMDYSAGVG